MRKEPKAETLRMSTSKRLERAEDQEPEEPERQAEIQERTVSQKSREETF